MSTPKNPAFNIFHGFQQIKGLAWLSFREGMAKKNWLVCLVYVLVLFAGLNGLQADKPEDRQELLLGISISSALILTTLTMVFLSAMSLSEEIADKSVVNILCKPVSRIKILAGKVCGFCALAGFFFLCMYCITALFFAFGPGLGQTLHSRELWLPGHFEHITKNELEKKKAQESERYWVMASNPDSALQWVWPNIRPGIFGPNPEVEFFYATSLFNHYDVSTEDYAAKIIFEGNGSSESIIPLSQKVGSLSCKIPNEIIPDSGTLKITLSLKSTSELNEMISLGVRKAESLGDPQGAKIRGKEKNFYVNLFRSFFLAFLECSFLTTVCVMASSFLNGGVSILVGMFFFVTGSILSYIRQCLDSFIINARMNFFHGRELSDIDKAMMETVKNTVEFLTTVLPDFERLNPLPLISSQIQIPFSMMLTSFAYLGAYAVLGLALGWLAFRKMELQ